jgi:hypothetical protein
VKVEEVRRRKKSRAEDLDSDRESVDNKVQRILDTVNASVTRQLLQACHFKNGYEPSSPRSSSTSPNPLRSSPPEETYDHEQQLHNNNNNPKTSNGMLLEGERKRKKNGIEGLAARLEFSQKKQRLAAAAESLKEHGHGGPSLTPLANGSGAEEEHEAHSSSDNEEGEQGKLLSIFALRISSGRGN